MSPGYDHEREKRDAGFEAGQTWGAPKLTMTSPDPSPVPESTPKPAGFDGPSGAVASGYALQNTRITQSGVMRCCIATVAEEYEGKDGAEDQKVVIGMKSRCRHCREPFTLTEAKPHPMWKPDWQLNGENTIVSQSATSADRLKSSRQSGG